MNNAIYRSGHLQNSITIDPAILEKAEILFGPSSVIYGSDAIGGVISYFSKTPIISHNHSFLITPKANIQSMSASNTFRSNININAGFKKWASLTSFSYSNFGDIKMGNHRTRSTNPNDWGKVYYYSKRINGKDSMMTNKNPNVQLNTGYKQYDILQKFKFDPSPNHSIILNSQFSTSSNINRFDQLNDYKGNLLKFSEYYYGPQNRLFLSASSLYKKDSKLFSSIHSIIAYQNIKESRFSRKFNNLNKLSQKEKLHIFSLNTDMVKLITNRSKLNYGLEIIFNNVNSNALYTDIVNSTKSDAPTRYPNGGSFSQSYSLYANYTDKLNKKFTLNVGVRIGYYQYNSIFKKDIFFTPIIRDLVMRNCAPSGSIGVVYKPNSEWKISGIVATGYRVPNVDDYGKIRAKNEEISIPNTSLKPENAYNLELSITKSFNEEAFILNLTLFNTWLNDAIVRNYYSYNGNDSILYGDDWYRMFTNTNTNKAIIKGLSAGAIIQPTQNLSIHGSFNYTQGKIISTNEPLGHIAPIFGKISTTYRYNKFRTEIYMNYQGTKKAADMSPYGEDNEDEGTLAGFPAWKTINLSFQYRLTNLFKVQASMENILDRHYKTFASGISASGRNIIISLTYPL